MSPENILLRLPESQEQEIRKIYEALAQRGFPVQQQRPHVSVTFAPEMSRAVISRAGELLPLCLPARLDRVGTVVFGTKSKQTVAWLLQGPDELERAARELSELNPDGRGARWIPHLTMGLRLPKAMVGDYIQTLAEVTSPHFRAVDAEYAALYQPRFGSEYRFEP